MSMTGTTGEFSVTQFFKEDAPLQDQSYEIVRSHVSAEEAVDAAKHYCSSVAAQLGFTTRVIITDGGDCINFEWQYGKGITYGKTEETNIQK